MSRALLADPFDPLTLAQVDVARRAARLFDEVVLAVDSTPLKNELLPPDERLALLRAVFAGEPTVSVATFSGLLPIAAQQLGAQVIVRGLSGTSDFEQEMQAALLGRRLAPEVDWLFLMVSADVSFMSSGIVREVALLGGDVSPFVPPEVHAALLRRAR